MLLRITFISLLITSLMVGCASVPRNPVPLDKQELAQIPGIEHVRAISGLDNPWFEEDTLFSDQQYRQHLAIPGTEQLDLFLLILSGGADYGAFGAGLLNGWSQSGGRPEFKIVTGVSSGALISTFAFLGPEYDPILREAYTTVTARDIYLRRFLSILWHDALADVEPLRQMIDRYITQDILDSVAEAHAHGRRLWIATTNLDQDRMIVWNMGMIAQSGHPDALSLYRKVVLASSSIPAAFPPVMINVEVDGQIYDEMHVDGGIKAQLFLNPDTLNLTRIRAHYTQPDIHSNWTFYVIRNSKVGPEPQQVERNIRDISSRSMSSLLKSQGRNDIQRIYYFSQATNVNFNWTAMPQEYLPETLEAFDQEEMNKLFDLGYEQGLNGGKWRNKPPVIGQH
jgi:predicted patatin/cPLA2 family phospholipase